MNNFNPEDLYTQKPVYTNVMPGYEDDEYTSNIRQLSQRHHVPQYQMQSMPQMPSLNSIEDDIENLLVSNIVSKDRDHEDDDGHIINKDYNTSSLIENNITEKKYVEGLQDHYVVIDSSDRDITKYPNPFLYKVYFNSFASNDASITRNFSKVKSVKLESGILPTKYYFLKQDIALDSADDLIVSRAIDTSRNEMINLTTEDVSGTFAIIDVVDVLNDAGTVFTRRIKFAPETTYPEIITKAYEYTFTFNSDSGELPADVHASSPSYPTYIQQYLLQTYSLMTNKYNLLYIDELEYANEYSTNDALGKSFSVMFPDCANTNVYYTTSKFKDKVYKFSNLGNINKMSISLRNHDGVQLKNSEDNYVDTDVPNNKLCTCGTDNNGYFKRDYRCACSYFRHPLYHYFQNTLIFKIKAYDINLDKEIFH